MALVRFGAVLRFGVASHGVLFAEFVPLRLCPAAAVINAVRCPFYLYVICPFFHPGTILHDLRIVTLSVRFTSKSESVSMARFNKR